MRSLIYQISIYLLFAPKPNLFDHQIMSITRVDLRKESF